ncbi:MAG: hypothetical protein KBT06_04610 [Prevotellaceae bacterium]|nr:hypothetical protein [Candidatus Colivivens equi]
MENEFDIIYDNSIIEEHPYYAKCKSDMMAISAKDYGDKYKFDANVKALDLDDLEKTFQKSSLDNTMDVAIGIRPESKSTSSILLIEYKMGYKSINNISCTNLKSKVRHSCDLLQSNSQIYNQIQFFVFSESLYEQARRYFNQKQRSKEISPAFTAISPSLLAGSIHSKDIGNTHKYSNYDISSSIFKHIQSCDINKVISTFQYWCEEQKKCGYHNDNSEQIYIQGILKPMWKNFLTQNMVKDEDSMIDIEILLDEYPWLNS